MNHPTNQPTAMARPQTAAARKISSKPLAGHQGAPRMILKAASTVAQRGGYHHGVPRALATIAMMVIKCRSDKSAPPGSIQIREAARESEKGPEAALIAFGPLARTAPAETLWASLALALSKAAR